MDKIEIRFKEGPAAEVECDSWKVRKDWFVAFEKRKRIAMFKIDEIIAIFRI